MKGDPEVPLDIQIGIELNRALLSRNGDAAVCALADFIRTHRLHVSEEAWRFLEYSVVSQRNRPRL